MDRQKAKELLEKYWRGECSPEEKQLLDAAFNKFPRMNTRQYTEKEYATWLAEIWQKLDRETSFGKRSKYLHILPVIRYAAAVVILIAVASASYFYLFRPPDRIPAVAVREIVPGGNIATLTLANGQKITLNNKKEGLVTGSNGLVYRDGSNVEGVDNIPLTEASAPMFLTLTTPNGGQYQVRLPDGTNVWLNSASTLRYPASFASLGDRRVTLSGEGYFEVTHDPSRPFRVVTGTQVVEVLGTHFNINAYEDEPAEKTTLLQGSIRVKSLDGGAARILRPNQQAAWDGNGLVVKEVLADEMVAWKNGDIVFNGASLEAIMRQISRWYDVEVEYRGHIPQVSFSGSVSRKRPITEVLGALEASQSVHFEIEGRRVVAMP